LIDLSTIVLTRDVWRVPGTDVGPLRQKTKTPL